MSDYPDSDESQTDLFADTQVSTANSYVSESQPNKWKNEKNMMYPWMVIFNWGGESPFSLLTLTDVDPGDIDGSWLGGILSPKSRLKKRKMKFSPDNSVSIFGKIHKGKNDI